MKQSWQIPAAVAATAVLTFAGVSALQTTANAPLKAIGAGFRSQLTPSPNTPAALPLTAGIPDGASALDDVLAKTVWGGVASQAGLKPGHAEARPAPLKARAPHSDGPDAGRAPEAADAAPQRGDATATGPTGPQGERSPGTVLAGHAGRSQASWTPGGSGQRRAPSSSESPSPVIVTAQQGGYTAWGTSKDQADAALKAIRLQGGKASKPSSGQPGNGNAQ